MNRSVKKTFAATAVKSTHKGIESLHSGELRVARTYFEKALDREPTYPDALHGLGIVALQEGDYKRSSGLLERSIAVSEPAPVDYYYNLGGVYLKIGESEKALTCYRAALQKGMDNPGSLRNMGHAFYQSRRYAWAADCYEKLATKGDESVENLCRLGAALKQSGDAAKAVTILRRALAIDPSSLRVFNLLGNALYSDERESEAIEVLTRATEVDPESAELSYALAYYLESYGEREHARREYERLYAMNHNDGTLIRLTLICPVIMQSWDEIKSWRKRLDAALDDLMVSDLKVGYPLKDIQRANFFLAYHGVDVASVQKKIGRLMMKSCPTLEYTSPHCSSANRSSMADGRIRIGLISNHFRNHSIGKTSVGLVRLLPRDVFHVVVLFIGSPTAKLGQDIDDSADESVYLPRDLEQAHQLVANLNLDVLFYQDIGMDAFTWMLSFARLAPVQCTSFGHPMTSGVPTIDYYISTEDWEPEDGDAHYTEQLVRLKGVSSVAYCYPPALPDSTNTRDTFGFSEDRHIYVCPQTIFKFHPDMDEVFAGILRKDPQGDIVLVRGKPAHWSEILEDRFRKTIPDVCDRIIFLPRQNSDDFKRLIAISDVSLDTLHFCGFNTTLEAFAMSTPVVTMPGEFMRSRHTAAFYRRMGFNDCVAQDIDEYIAIATRLACDPEFHEEVVQKIEQHRDRLWEEDRVIDEYTRFFQSVVQ